MANISGSKHGKVIHNRSKPKPISENQAKTVADTQIWAREFRPDYDQVVKRISTAPTGLRYGAPPGIVT